MSEQDVTKQSIQDELSAAQNKASKGQDAKIRLNLTPNQDHPLSSFTLEIKKRGIKDLELSDLVLAALEQVPASFWQEKLEEVTPLEYRVNMALTDPAMREKLSKLLVN